MPRYAHALTCGCNKCRLSENGCPECGDACVGGQYSKTPPYEWSWTAGDGDYPLIVKFCPNCGAKLPDRGRHPDAPA